MEIPNFRPNPKFPQLCDKVTVGWDRKRGRFVKALENIPLGTVVCVEQGITVNVDPGKCYRCLSNIGADGFAYCGDCEEFYEPDELACGDFDELGIFKLAAHLVFSFPFIEIAALIQSDEPEVPKSAPESLSTKDISSVLQLTPFPEIGETFKVPEIQEAIERIVHSLDTDANWGRLEYGVRVITFTKALRIMAERCAKNAHTIYSIEQKESQEDQIPLGTGMFPIASIFNHSCNPNVSAFFIGNTFIFVSHGVRAGEELVDSYGVTLEQHTFQERKNFLANVSGFDCHCESCVKRKSLDDKLTKNFNDVAKCAESSSCLMDISDYLDFMETGAKDVESLIVEFAKRRDSEVYTEKMFQLWKMFVDNARGRGIQYDPYLVRPYLEMSLLAWNDEVECSESEKASILTVTHRLLRNFFADQHPVSRSLNALFEAAIKGNSSKVRECVEKLGWAVRAIWRIGNENDDDDDDC